MEALPERARADFRSEIRAYREDLQAGGCCLASAAVGPRDAATRLEVRHGRVSIADGALVDGRHGLREFYLIEARDLNDVLRVVSHMPPARLGSVEVWPVAPQP